MFPDDLVDKAPDWVAHELFGEDLAAAVLWKLTRVDATTFEWEDVRFSSPWRMTHGFLVGLHEVGTRAQAREFARRNRITLFEDGGLFHKNTAEIFIRASLPPSGELKSVNDLYRVRTQSGIEATVGYGSLVFSRLVAGPAADEFDDMPTPDTLTTLVLKGVERDETRPLGEQALYHLRNVFPGCAFLPGRIPDLVDTPDAPAGPPPATLVDGLLETTRPEAIAFYNRAEESEPVLGFLYLYRVLEACFDDVLVAEIAAWRADRAVTELELLKRVRGLTQKEDVWSLRSVLGKIVDQPLLDGAAKDGLIADPTADALGTAIYLRRNSIAHGRRGQHDRVLVPFCVSGQDGARDLLWRDLMKVLAAKALARWILGH